MSDDYSLFNDTFVFCNYWVHNQQGVDHIMSMIRRDLEMFCTALLIIVIYCISKTHVIHF